MNNLVKNFAIWIIIGLVLMTVFNEFNKKPDATDQVVYSQFISDVESGKVQSLTIEGHPLRGQILRGKRVDGSTFSTYAPYDPQMVDDLIKNHVSFAAKPDDFAGNNPHQAHIAAAINQRDIILDHFLCERTCAFGIHFGSTGR